MPFGPGTRLFRAEPELMYPIIAQFKSTRPPGSGDTVRNSTGHGNLGSALKFPRKLAWFQDSHTPFDFVQCRHLRLTLRISNYTSFENFRGAVHNIFLV
jgi:hypothetical protein